MSCMAGKVVTRSVRLEAEFDGRIERLAAERGQSVSAFIRAARSEASERDERRLRLETALQIAAGLPDLPMDRDEMWGIDSRISR